MDVNIKMPEAKYLLKKIKNENFPIVSFPKATYENEIGINPFYFDIESSPKLCIGESRIWAARADAKAVIAVGIKNAYNEARGSTIFDRVEDISLSNYIHAQNRYGHPSLTIPEDCYDGSVYDAGWVYQNKDRLDVLMWSGRFSNKHLNQIQKQQLEQYIALKFMKAWGEQPVVFIRLRNDEDMHLFFQGTLSNETIPYRTYENFNNIKDEIFDSCVIDGDLNDLVLACESSDINLEYYRQQSLLYFEKQLEEFKIWSNKSPVYSFFLSIYSWSDLHIKSQKLISEIRRLREDWIDADYISFEQDYAEFCLNAGIKYKQKECTESQNISNSL